MNFEDDILTLCPELAKYGVGPGITVDNLLQMRSGLPDVWHFPLMSGLRSESYTTEELLALLKDHPAMLRKPGTEYMYCNTNYFLLSKIVEIIAKRPPKGKHPLLHEGQSFVDFVREYVFKPHNMGARCSADKSCPPTIDGFNSKAERVATLKTQSMVFGAHGVVGCPKDMLEWIAAITRGELDKLLVPPEGVAAGKDGIYCRGLRVCNMGRWCRISSSGDADGYLASLRIYKNLDDPSKSFAFFMTSNYEHHENAELAVEEIANALAGEMIEVREYGPSPHVQEPRVNEEWVRSSFEGNYTCVDFGTDVHVSVVKSEKGIWQVCISSSNPGHHELLTEPLSFSPAFDEKGDVIWQLPDVGKLELTTDGFVCKRNKTGPISFRKKV